MAHNTSISFRMFLTHNQPKRQSCIPTHPSAPSDPGQNRPYTRHASHPLRPTPCFLICFLPALIVPEPRGGVFPAQASLHVVDVNQITLMILEVSMTWVRVVLFCSCVRRRAVDDVFYFEVEWTLLSRICWLTFSPPALSVASRL